MAAAASNSIRRELADITECAICTEVYTDPRSLPCLHTYCLKCIEQLVGNDKQHADSIACPLCRTQFSITSSGLTALPKNFFIEKMKLIKELSAATGSTTNYCDECQQDETEKKLAVVYCVDCQGKLCQSCDDSHNALKVTRAHKRVSLGDESCSGKLRGQSTACEKHVGRNMELFCTECKVVICMMCFVADHNSHKCVDVNDVAEEFRRQIKQGIASIVGGIGICDNMVKYLSNDKHEFVIRVEQLEREICDKAEEMKQNIERHKQIVLAELDTIKRERLKQVEHLSDDIQQRASLLQSLKQYTKALYQKGTASDIGREKKALLARTDELLTLGGLQRSGNQLTSVDVHFTASSMETDSKACDVVGRITLKRARNLPATSGFTTYAAVDTSPQTTGMSTYPPPDDVSEDEHLTEESAATRTGTIWQKQDIHEKPAQCSVIPDYYDYAEAVHCDLKDVPGYSGRSKRNARKPRRKKK